MKELVGLLYKITEELVRKEKPWTTAKGTKGTMVYICERTTHWFLGIPVLTDDRTVTKDFKELVYPNA